MTDRTWFTYKVKILFETPYIAPALSPNKAMKKLQIQDLVKCYSEEFKDIVEHIDRSFMRDSQCNVLIPGHIFTSALREALPKSSNIIVRGAVLIPQKVVRIGTSKVNNSLVNYEYIPSGTIMETNFKINEIMKEEVTVFIGARKFKGFGRTKLKFNLEV